MVKVERDGSFAATVPVSAEENRKHRAALRATAHVQQEDWDRLRESLPHRSGVRPQSTALMERRAQEMSLGRLRSWRPELNLHPMPDRVYLYNLALRFPELRRRLDIMREEMVARPEEFGSDLFNPFLWRDLRPKASLEAEVSLAVFIRWVACPDALGTDECCRVLNGLMRWSTASRAAFSDWVRHPWFCPG